MNEYTASNGYRVVSVSDNRPVSWLKILNKNPDPGVNERHSLGLYSVEALREFFRAEEDVRLGRWRSTSDSSWTAVRRNKVVYFQNEDHERSFHVVLGNKGSFRAWHADLQAVAREYADAHPEPKPWHEAKDGEIWEVEFALPRASEATEGYRTNAFVAAGAFIEKDGTRVALDAVTIASGRRIYPEGD